MKIQLLSFVVQCLFFLMKLLGFMSKALKLLLTELVGQWRNILPLTFNAGKGRRQYIPALISHSVNKITIV